MIWYNVNVEVNKIYRVNIQAANKKDAMDIVNNMPITDIQEEGTCTYADSKAISAGEDFINE